MNAPSKRERVLSLFAGTSAAAASVALSVSHLVEGGQPLVSPLTGASVALSFASAVAAIVAGAALNTGRRTIAAGLLVAVLAGETFSLISSAERMLIAREQRSRDAALVNTTRSIAVDRVKAAETIYANAEAAYAAEASRSGCGKACRDLRQAADEARSRVEVARAELLKAPASKSNHLLADTLGIDPLVVEIVPALLFSLSLNGLAFILLAFGAHTPVRLQESLAKDAALGRRQRTSARNAKAKGSRRAITAALGPSKSTVTRQIAALAKSGAATVKKIKGLTLISFKDD